MEKCENFEKSLEVVTDWSSSSPFRRIHFPFSFRPVSFLYSFVFPRVPYKGSLCSTLTRPFFLPSFYSSKERHQKKKKKKNETEKKSDKAFRKSFPAVLCPFFFLSLQDPAKKTPRATPFGSLRAAGHVHPDELRRRWRSAGHWNHCGKKTREEIS